MGLPVIDWTVSVGNILQVIAFIGAGLAMFFAMRADIRVIRHDLSNIKERQNILNEAFTQLGNILTKVAVQDERLNAMAKDIDEMRHGQGFVNPMRS